ncbi:thaumatin [Gilbertella persicaria]|uniref:thaumatin n=1 Tax=Gilbertella persicaria TaxID=101096 RepID=UPI002220E23D|nr:thaumatin [Gilbertella persicaria]KAI8094845.1 thaumatin [Gilbertella persicaria]
MYYFVLILSLVSAAPLNTQIKLVNQCGYTLQIGYQTNNAPHHHIIQVQDTHTLTVAHHWAGRIWAKASSGDYPATLAEFRLGELDYYDVSLVDGFNLPLRIEPQSTEHVELRHCQPSGCLQLPSCPKDLQVFDQHQLVACASPCSVYGTDDYCCTGTSGTSNTCTLNYYAQQVKQACPDVYSYAFDDATSVYGCKTHVYHVVFCPQ